MSDSQYTRANKKARHCPGRSRRRAGSSVVVGVVLLTLALVFGFLRGDDLAYFFHAYLVSFCFYLSISLGGLFFVALQHASRAGWSVAVRRVAEIIAANTLVMAVLFLPVLLPLLWGNTALYEWLNPQLVADGPPAVRKERVPEFAVLYAAGHRLLCGLGNAGLVLLATIARAG